MTGYEQNLSFSCPARGKWIYQLDDW